MSSGHLHVKPEFNAEEAAHAASDIVGSLENLPGEVSFLLQEIKEKDMRIESLLTRINTRHYGLTKNISRIVQSAASSSSASTPTTQINLPIPPNGPLPTDHLAQKEAQAIQKIQGEWDKIEILQEEKVKLADRMERIVARARERARAEWVKVGGLDVEEIEWEAGAGMGMGVGGEIVLPPSGLGSGSDVRQKKRKPQPLPLPPPSQGHIFHPPNSSMPPPPPPSRPSLSARSSYATSHPTHSHSHTHKNQRTSRKSTTASFRSESEDMDVDADGDAEVDADAEGEVEGDTVDDTLYCICRKVSHGEMIGCDNENCEIEWFHIGCVGATDALDTWYCPDCVRKLGLSSSNGSKPGRGAQKGRKR